MVSIREYKMATSLEEAYNLNQKKTNAIMGGMGWLKMQKRSLNVAIDMSNLGLDTIIETKDEYKIGAMVTLRQLEINKEITDFFGEGITDALKHIVGVQFRNCATVGGSIRMRFGFSDVLTALMALEAQVELYNKGIVAMEEYAKLPYDRDIVVGIIIPKRQTSMKYLSVRNSSTDFPVVAVAVARNENGFKAVIGARPQRAEMVRDDKGILDGEITDERITEFAEYVVNMLNFGTNRRGTAPYRRHVARVLIRRAVKLIIGGEE